MAKEAKKLECEEKGIEYDSEEEEEDTDIVPYITKEMLQISLSQASKSVTKADLDRYMKYKRDMERRIGMDKGGGSSNPPPPSFKSEQPQTYAAPSTGGGGDNGAARDFGDDDSDSDDD